MCMRTVNSLTVPAVAVVSNKHLLTLPSQSNIVDVAHDPGVLLQSGRLRTMQLQPPPSRVSQLS